MRDCKILYLSSYNDGRQLRTGDVQLSDYPLAEQALNAYLAKGYHIAQVLPTSSSASIRYGVLVFLEREF